MVLKECIIAGISSRVLLPGIIVQERVLMQSQYIQMYEFASQLRAPHLGAARRVPALVQVAVGSAAGHRVLTVRGRRRV